LQLNYVHQPVRKINVQERPAHNSDLHIRARWLPDCDIANLIDSSACPARRSRSLVSINEWLLSGAAVGSLNDRNWVSAGMRW